MKTVRPITINASVLTSTSVPQVEALWSSGTTYSLGQAVYVIVGNVRQRFVSAQGSNLNHNPATDDGTWWTDEGPTNAWAMFDDTSTTVTSDADDIEVVLALPAGERADVVYLAGLTGVSVRVRVTDPLAGPVYDQTHSLADVSGVASWPDWLWLPLAFKTELLVSDLPNGAGSTLTVTINHPGETATCGTLVCGQRRTLGDTAWDAEIEIRDYSRWIENDFGDRVLVEGAYRKLMNATAILPNTALESVVRELISGRAQARLYIADERYTPLVIFGTARWKTRLDGPPDISRCDLTVEGNS